MSYRSEDRFILVDPQYESRHPGELDHLYRLEVPMASPGPLGHGDEAEAAAFEPFADSLNAAAEALGLVAEGRRRGFGVWDLAWYGPAGAEKHLVKTLKGRPDTHLSVSVDHPDWEHYRNTLLPRGEELHRARNGLMVKQLLKAGDSLEAPRPIEFFVHFHREVDRDRYPRDVGSTGLDAEPIAGELPGIRAFFVAGVDVELITDITWELHERAQLANGEFEGWGCPPSSRESTATPDMRTNHWEAALCLADDQLPRGFKPAVGHEPSTATAS
jgi:hypothetical protein